MAYFYPTTYILDIPNIDYNSELWARAYRIADRCKANGAREKTNEEAKADITGLTSSERYHLGKETLHIKALKRSCVHFFNSPKGAIESPQLVINHGMLCPHSCQYCYWQKDLRYSSRIVVYANPKEKIEADLKYAVAIWRVLSALLNVPSCKNRVDDRLFVRLDTKLKKESIKTSEADLEVLCTDIMLNWLEKWKIPGADIESLKAILKNPDYKKNVIFNSGENNDSVALEHLTDTQKDILIPTILGMDNAYLMLRTKSIRYGFLEPFKDHPKKDRIIISPSLIPEQYIQKYEPGNYTLNERLTELAKLAGWGFKIFPCFSPLIYEGGSWGNKLKEFIKLFSEFLPPNKIQYYTVGTLRLSTMALRNIRMIHQDTNLDSYHFVSPKHTSGDKFRYSKVLRTKMYADFIRQMNKNGYDKVPRFLQTETIEAWKALTTDKYKDLCLDLGKYQSGVLDLEALSELSTIANVLPN